jgi:hypothetical protein
MIDVNNYAGPSGTRLFIPTHISPAGGQTTHPSVVKFATPFSGYTYWMAHSPYPLFNDAHEDPNVVASNDGVTWVVPPGLTNPLDDNPGSPNAYNSDPNLYYRASNSTLYLFWRELNRALGSNQEKLYYRSSTDGITWTAKVLMRQVTTTNGKMLAPSLTWLGTQWAMYVVDMDVSPNTFVRYLSTGDSLTAWGSATNMTITGLAPGRDIWHVDVQQMGTDWVGFGTTSNLDAGGVGTRIHTMASANGTAWTISANPAVPVTGSWYDNAYKAGFVPRTDAYGNIDFDVWFSGYVQSSSVSDVMRTTVTHQRDVIAPSAPTSLSTTLSSTVSGVRLTWTPSTDDVGVTGYQILRGGVVIDTAAASPYTDTTAFAGASFSYTVKAFDGAGNLSAASTASVYNWATPTTTVPVYGPPGTSPTVKILGTGDFGGASSAVGSYTVTEDATPTDMSNLSGGVGGITFSAREDPSFNGSLMLSGQPFMLMDPYAGELKGVIDSITAIDEMTMTVAGSTLLLPLVAVKSAEPFSGTLGSAINYYASLCGILSGIQIDSAIASKTVALPGWTGEVWAQLKKLGAIHQFEIAGVSDVIIVRGLRQRTLDVSKYSAIRSTYGRADSASEVQVYYYNNTFAINKVVYPPADVSIIDRNIITVDASEETTVNLPVDMWVKSIVQPTVFSSLGQDETVLSSSYSVVDADGTPVTPTDWINGGGSMRLEIGADGKSIDVIIRGTSTQYRSPYRIAASSADKTYQYAALFIVATGVAFDRQVVTSPTGAPIQDAPVSDITVIDDPMVSSIADAYAVLSNAVRRANGHSQSIEATASAVNRRGETGQVIYPTFGQFDATIPGSTFTTYNATISGQTFAVWDSKQAAITGKNFATQAFGGIGGARVQYRDAKYRVVSASSSAGSHNWTAEYDTLFNEFNPNWTAKTFTQLNAFWAGKTFAQYALAPLAH